MSERIEKSLPVTVSGVRAGEGPAVKELIAGCGLPTADITSETLRSMIVARKGPRIIGTVGLEVSGSFGLLRSLAVLEKFRGQGVANQLLVAAEKSARQRGIRTLYLLTLTAEKYFFDRGYRKVERSSAPDGIRDTAEFRTLCPDSAVCMCKPIG